MRAISVLVLAIALAFVSPSMPASAAALTGVSPITGLSVSRGFDPPAVKWGSGHRGVDLAATPGTVVRAPADGTVTYAKVLAGRPVLVISHGALRTTLEPVRATVSVGTHVTRGQAVGVLVAGHDCPAASCLHWGLKRGDQYLDPLSLLRSEVRLLSDAATADIKRRAAARAAAIAAALARGGGGNVSGSGALSRPVPGAITSRFGRRFHPIFHVWRLHAGVDFSASCGSPIHAARTGVVSHVGFDSSGGWRLIINHGTVNGARLQTIYLHAQGYRVRVGQKVTVGQTVGKVGSTGWSTGCHLHFSVKANGAQVDPQRWL